MYKRTKRKRTNETTNEKQQRANSLKTSQPNPTQPKLPQQKPLKQPRRKRMDFLSFDELVAIFLDPKFEEFVERNEMSLSFDVPQRSMPLVDDQDYQFFSSPPISPIGSVPMLSLNPFEPMSLCKPSVSADIVVPTAPVTPPDSEQNEAPLIQEDCKLQGELMVSEDATPQPAPKTTSVVHLKNRKAKNSKRNIKVSSVLTKLSKRKKSQQRRLSKTGRTSRKCLTF